MLELWVGFGILLKWLIILGPPYAAAVYFIAPVIMRVVVYDKDDGPGEGRPSLRWIRKNASPLDWAMGALLLLAAAYVTVLILVGIGALGEQALATR